MDAAYNLKKSALFLAIALSIAAPASAQLTLNGSATPNPITIGSSGAGTSVSVGPATPTDFTVSYSSTWFTVSPTSGTTPASLTITPSGVAGQCVVNASICPDKTVTVNGASSSASITVKFASSGGTGTGALTVSTTQLTISAASGSAGGGSVAVSAITPTSFTASISNNSCTGALTLANGLTTYTGLMTPYTVTVYANAGSPYLLPNGTQCTGTLTLTPASGTATSVNVVFNVTSSAVTTGTLLPSTTTVSFAYPSGTLSQYLNVGTSNASVQVFNASISSTYGWLTFCNGTTAIYNQPIGTSSLCVMVNTAVAAGLGTSAYNATITLQNPYNTSDTSTIAATLSVNGGTSTTTGTSVSPTALTFSYETGAYYPPPDQLIAVNGSGTITVSNVVATGGWLAPNPVGGTAPGFVGVHVIPQSCGTTSCNGSFTVSTSGGTSQSISVALNVTSSTQPVLVVNPNGYGDIACNYTAGVSGSSQCNTTLSLVSSDNTATIGTTVTSSASWVVPTCTGTTTPNNCSVAINPSSLPNGINTANLTITASGAANTPVTVPVVILVSGSSTSGGTLTLSTSTLTLNPGAGSSQTQQLSVSASTITSFTASANQGSCTGGTSPAWLTVSPVGTMNTPQTLTVTGSAAGLSNGTICNGSISLVANSVIQTVMVTMNVGGSGGTSTFSITPSTLPAITYQVGGAAPSPVPLTLASTPTGVAFTASIGGGGACSALSPSVTSGTTPQSFFINVSTTSLTTAGTSNCTLNVTAGSTTQTFPITLTVSAAVTVSASPTSLSFTYAAGGQTPASQSINVTGGTGLTFSATAASTGNWLSVTPATGTTPGTLTVSVSPSSLTPSPTPYTGTITVAGTGSATGSTTINVSLTVTAPQPTIDSVTNAASFSTGAIAPGEIITIFGKAIGPTPAAGLALNPDGTVSTSIGGVQVYINGVLAPMVYASATQVSAVVPYDSQVAAFKSASIVLKYQGQSGTATAPISTTNPGIFTLNSSGTGPGAILNVTPAGAVSVNSHTNPAHAGDVVVIYMTGEGQTVPTGVTGKVTTANLPAPQVTPAPVLPVGATIDGAPVRVLYDGEAPGFVSGVMQVNVQIPANARAGELPLVVSVGGSPSQSGVTVSVQ